MLCPTIFLNLMYHLCLEIQYFGELFIICLPTIACFPLLSRVHRQLVRIFASGIEDPSEAPPAIFKSCARPNVQGTLSFRYPFYFH